MHYLNLGQVPNGIYSESHCKGMPNSKFATERDKIYYNALALAID